MADPTPRVKLPRSFAVGEVIEVKTMITHPMESGRRKDPEGNTIRRNIIHRFSATFNGAPVVAADWAPAIAANPFLAFHLKVDGPGELLMTWEDDSGQTYQTSRTLTPA
ncbi:thiosulfate oxidation carrier complex protein SoxZ [Roseospirillum parvum]|uniref:Sulfur-oxidizing protein SoxZ n=1 Tax=Roseospirillum parvum TaxID=83401 RepID=A0A1G8AL91_9PROT|nr:thiosulfate oxidation carrier complex protein SoxZ [Roseospirillum parvum]SDH21687.1 sulfur-oxidizing protein SoxZ [Roseospirillum parvum]